MFLSAPAFRVEPTRSRHSALRWARHRRFADGPRWQMLRSLQIADQIARTGHMPVRRLDLIWISARNAARRELDLGVAALVEAVTLLTADVEGSTRLSQRSRRRVPACWRRDRVRFGTAALNVGAYAAACRCAHRRCPAARRRHHHRLRDQRECVSARPRTRRPDFAFSRHWRSGHRPASGKYLADRRRQVPPAGFASPRTGYPVVSSRPTQ